MSLARNSKRVASAKQSDPLPPFHVGNKTPDEAHLALQEYKLDDESLTISLGCRNLLTARMPCSLAQFLYFPCDDKTTIDVQVESAWTADAQTLPVSKVPASGRDGLSARKICGAGLDNAFEGWAGTADFDWPAQPIALRMSSTDRARFYIYSPVTGRQREGC
jgi:galactose mutarotase-like enzyme